MPTEGPRETWSREDEETLSELMNGAGPREAFPADLSRLRSAVEERWLDSRKDPKEISEETSVLEAPRRTRRTRRTRRPIWWWAAASFLAVLALTFLVLPSSEHEAPALAFVGKSDGPVKISSPRDGGIQPGTLVETGPGGRVAFRLEGERTLRLDEGTRLRFARDRRVEVLTGAVYSDSGPSGSSGSGLILQTPFGEIREVGTQYEVRLAPSSLRIRVREGRVELESSSGETREEVVEAGEELYIGPDGSLRRSGHQPDDASWGWVLAAAPAMDIEGATLKALLTWTAREGGWTLTFPQAGIEQQAEEILLHGSVEGLPLLEGLGLAMEGSRLTARLEGSKLIVEALEAPRFKKPS